MVADLGHELQVEEGQDVELLRADAVLVKDSPAKRMRYRRLAQFGGLLAAATLLAMCGGGAVMVFARGTVRAKVGASATDKTAESIEEPQNLWKSHASMALHYDCEAGLANAQEGWSVEKKAWCCHTFTRGCSPLRSEPRDDATRVYTPTRQHEIILGNNRVEHGNALQSHERYSTLDRLDPPHTEPHTLQLPYDCDAGLRRWRDGWSVEKKLWCCHTYQRGCARDEHSQSALAPHSADPVMVPYNRLQQSNVPFDVHHRHFVAAERFDCSARDASRISTWSMTQRRYCCSQHSQGCGVERFPWFAWRIIVGTFGAVFACIAACVCYRECARQQSQTSDKEQKASQYPTGGARRGPDLGARGHQAAPQWYH